MMSCGNYSPSFGLPLLANVIARYGSTSQQMMAVLINGVIIMAQQNAM